MPVDGDLRQLPFVDGLYDRDEVTLETGQNDLAFRVAEPDIILQDFRAGRRNHQPNIEHTLINNAFLP